MYGEQPFSRERAGSVVAVAAVHAALGYALIAGLTVELPRLIARSMATFTVLPAARPEPPPRPQPRPHRAPHREGAAAPANVTATATELVAPPPIVPPTPVPVTAATTVSTGTANHSGAAPVPGPGTGSGGLGEGTGNGRSGDGPGGGGDGDGFDLISGRIKDSDFPRGAPDDGRARQVYVKIVIGIKGRITGCTVLRPSDSAILNNATCRLLTKRLRFRPSRDGRGKPVADYAFWEQTWTTDIRKPVEAPD